MPRQARGKSESGVYHIMIRGINQQIIFEDDEDQEKYLQLLRFYRKRCGFALYGYCLMDNHVHLLVKEAARPSIVTIMEKEDYEKKVGRLSELNNRMRSIAADKNLDLSSTVLEKKMVVKETPTQVKVKIPGTDGPEPVFVWLDKKDVVASNDGKSFLANIDKGHSYITHDKRDNQIGTIPGLLLITRHFNRDKEVDQSVLDKFIKAPVHEKKRVR